jgi:hypothetical protein
LRRPRRARNWTKVHRLTQKKTGSTTGLLPGHREDKAPGREGLRANPGPEEVRCPHDSSEIGPCDRNGAGNSWTKVQCPGPIAGRLDAKGWRELIELPENFGQILRNCIRGTPSVVAPFAASKSETPWQTAPAVSTSAGAFSCVMIGMLAQLFRRLRARPERRPPTPWPLSGGGRFQAVQSHCVRVDDVSRANRILKRAEGKRLTYRRTNLAFHSLGGIPAVPKSGGQKACRQER